MHRRNRRGFTLLELIVVLIIISLMSAIVVPRLVGPMSNLDLQTASKRISAALKYARDRAASEKETYAAFFDLDNNRLIIAHFVMPALIKGGGHINDRTAYDKMLAEWSNHETDEPDGLKVFNLPDGIKFAKGGSREEDFKSGLFLILFSPGGGSSGGQITVANERGRQYDIHVDFITGSVQLMEVTG